MRLKNFTESFVSRHKREPSRKEKEAVRPLYSQYNKVKRRLEELETPLEEEEDGGEMERLQEEKRELHGMLKRYEKEFEEREGRRVTNPSDIAPVAQEYERYKQVKKLIDQLS